MQLLSAVVSVIVETLRGETHQEAIPKIVTLNHRRQQHQQRQERRWSTQHFLSGWNNSPHLPESCIYRVANVCSVLASWWPPGWLKKPKKTQNTTWCVFPLLYKSHVTLCDATVVRRGWALASSINNLYRRGGAIAAPGTPCSRNKPAWQQGRAPRQSLFLLSPRQSEQRHQPGGFSPRPGLVATPPPPSPHGSWRRVVGSKRTSQTSLRVMGSILMLTSTTWDDVNESPQQQQKKT